MCMCVYMCASCSLHFYTCSRFSYFHAARTFYPTPLAFIFALFFAHIYLRRLLAIWNSFFSSFSFVASRNPARTISKVPLRSNVLDKLNGKERKVKSAQQQPHEQQESGRVAAAAAAPIYASFIAPYASQVSVCVTLSLSLSLGLLLLCNWLSGTRAVPLSASTHWLLAQVVVTVDDISVNLQWSTTLAKHV